MPQGITTNFHELIALRRCVGNFRQKPALAQGAAERPFSQMKGRGMDFAETRNYQAGDEIRHMEWRITARTGKPHIKLYHEERERPVVILTDFNPSMYFGTRIAFKSWVTAQLAALITWTAIQQKNRVGALLFSANQHHEFIPSPREKAVLPLLSALSDYTFLWEQFQHYPDNRPLSQMLMRLYRVVKPGSLVILISDFYCLDKDSAQHLRRLTEHNDMICYHVSDPLELAPPEPNLYAVTNNEQTFWLDTRDRAVSQKYQAHCHAQVASMRDLCVSRRIAYVPVLASDHLPRLVQTTLPRRFYA
jgi:uncharacterized protein (DUF58 family)